MSYMKYIVCLLSATIVCSSSSLSAADSADELLPESTLVVLEIPQPTKIVQGLLDHSYIAKVQELKSFEELTRNPQYLQGMTALRFIEFQLGMSWQDALKTLTEGGVTLAIDAQTEGVAILLKTSDPDELTKLRDKVVEIARKDAENNGKEDPYELSEYRGIQVYKTKDGGFLTHENWLIAGNNAELGKSIVDALLDGNDKSLATNEHYKEAKKRLQSKSHAWSFVNLEPLRNSDDKGLKKLFEGKADDPAGELLLGGILESFKNASYLTASLQGEGNSLALQFQVPFESESTSELREHYLGPKGQGRAEPLLNVPDMLFGLTAYRNVSEMWLRSGDLFNKNINDGIAQADSNLATFFSGRDFGEDILGALTPEVQIIASRQTYSEGAPVPAIKIPAFAFMANMKDPETTTREFRRIYQSFIGFFNVVGAMQGQPQFELDMETLKSGELISATPIPEIGEEKNQQAKINFNFSPTVAFSGNRLVISSATGLAKHLMDAKPLATTDSTNHTNTHAILNAHQLQATLDDNRSHLIAQNILKEGTTRDEATQKIGFLLEALDLFENVDLQLLNSGTTLDLEFGVHFKN